MARKNKRRNTQSNTPTVADSSSKTSPKRPNSYLSVDRSETIDKDRLHSLFDRSAKSIQDYLEEYQYISDYQTYKSLGHRVDHRHRLMDLYDYIMQDAHLSSIVDSLFQQILGERYYFVDPATNEKDEEATQAIRFSWFAKLIRGILESKPYGFTLLELGDYDFGTGTLKGVEFIERRNVAPRDNLVLERPTDQEGWDITDKAFATDYVLIDGQEGYGLLLKASPLVIAKRYSIGAHLHNAETYGIPFIHGKAEEDTHEAKVELANDIARAGRERIIVTGVNDSINLLQQVSNDTNKIYTTLVDLVNSELSKLFLGQTGTTESMTYVGSAQIMYQVYQDRIEALREFVVNVVNEKIAPRLIKKGMKNLVNKRFTYSNETETSPDVKIKQLDVLLKYFDLDPDVIEKETGIKVGQRIYTSTQSDTLLDENTLQAKKGQKDGDGDGVVGETSKRRTKAQKQATKANTTKTTTKSTDGVVNFLTRVVASFDAPVLSAIPLIEAVGAQYSSHFHHIVAEGDETADDKAYDEELAIILLLLFQGQDVVISAEMIAICARRLLLSFEQGYGIKFAELDLTLPENAFYKSILDNIFLFAAAKQHQVIEAMATVRSNYGTDEVDFAAFAAAAKQVNDLFNGAYERVENSHTDFSAEMAKLWRSIENPDTILEYVTMEDDKVRPHHAQLHGVKRRKSDPFWLIYFPPWQWGCRCSVRDTGSTNGQKLNMDRPLPDPELVPEAFRFNVGEAGIIFNQHHPYFRLPEQHVAEIKKAMKDAKKKLGYK